MLARSVGPKRLQKPALPSPIQGGQKDAEGSECRTPRFTNTRFAFTNTRLCFFHMYFSSPQTDRRRGRRREEKRKKERKEEGREEEKKYLKNTLTPNQNVFGPCAYDREREREEGRGRGGGGGWWERRGVTRTKPKQKAFCPRSVWDHIIGDKGPHRSELSLSP